MDCKAKQYQEFSGFRSMWRREYVNYNNENVFVEYILYVNSNTLYMIESKLSKKYKKIKDSITR